MSNKITDYYGSVVEVSGSGLFTPNYDSINGILARSSYTVGGGIGDNISNIENLSFVLPNAISDILNINTNVVEIPKAFIALPDEALEDTYYELTLTIPAEHQTEFADVTGIYTVDNVVQDIVSLKRTSEFYSYKILSNFLIEDGVTKREYKLFRKENNVWILKLYYKTTDTEFYDISKTYDWEISEYTGTMSGIFEPTLTEPPNFGPTVSYVTVTNTLAGWDGEYLEEGTDGSGNPYYKLDGESKYIYRDYDFAMSWCIGATNGEFFGCAGYGGSATTTPPSTSEWYEMDVIGFTATTVYTAV